MNDPKAKISRRHVFAGVGAAGALAVAVKVVPTTPQPVVASVKPETNLNEGGYQETPHVLHYYRTARI